jgi:L-lactate dehydrogenase
MMKVIFMNNNAVKISIIGAGFVGSTTAYALMLAGLASEIVMVDINKEKAIGEAMDLSHGTSFGKPVSIKAGEYEDTKDSDIVIITAGVGRKPGETRLDIINKNYLIFKDMIGSIAKYNPNSIFLVVSNPVDIFTYMTFKLSGIPASRVIGSGTVLDTSRFRYMLGKHFDVDARNIHTYILGEHGDSEIAAWSLTSIAGMGIDQYCKDICTNCDDSFKTSISDNVKNAGREVISNKGYTNYGIATSIKRIVEAILGDENSILTVSALLTGEYGINDVYMGVPCIVGRDGIKKVLQAPLSDQETQALKDSSNVLKGYLNNFKL